MGLTAALVFLGVILPSLNCLSSDPERHSLYYSYTALSKPIAAPGIFEFIAMGTLDGRKIDYYNSIDKVKIPQQEWMNEKLPSDYWEKGTQSRRSKEQWFKVNVNILMERKRQNGSDLHVLNWRHGCEVDKYPDGTVQFIKGADEYSYDGVNFLSFDDASMTWVAPVTEAMPTKLKWDGVPILNQYTKGYLEKECVDWLGKFMTYSEEELKQYSPPDVHLFARTSQLSGDKLSMTCLATGFHPKDIKMSIQRSGSAVLIAEPIDVLPNGDGTHQVRLRVEVPRADADEYQCVVEHRTLKTPVVSNWKTDGFEVDKALPIGPIVGGVVGGVAVVLCVVIAVVILVKRKLAANKTGESLKNGNLIAGAVGGKVVVLLVVIAAVMNCGRKRRAANKTGKEPLPAKGESPRNGEKTDQQENKKSLSSLIDSDSGMDSASTGSGSTEGEREEVTIPLCEKTAQ